MLTKTAHTPFVNNNTHLVVEVLPDPRAAEVHSGSEEQEEAAHQHRLLRQHVPLAGQHRHRQKDGERD